MFAPPADPARSPSRCRRWRRLAASSRSWSRKVLRRRAARSMLAIHMRTNPGWHGYWLNPGDAGLPMDVQWQLPRGFSAGPLRYPVPTRLDRRRPHELCLRAGLCRARAAEGAGGRARNVADPRRCALARLHRQDLRARAGPARRSTCRSAAGLRTARSSTSGGKPCRSRSRRVGHFEASATRSASRSRFRRASASASPTCSRSPTRCVDYEAKQDFRRSGDMLIAELKRTGATPQQFAGVLALGDGRGLEFHAVPGRGAGRRNADRRPRRERDPLGGAWRDRRRNPAQPDALRLPDPRAKALHLSRAGERRGATRARMRSPTPRARSSAPARSAPSCWRSALREPRRAGHSSCRTRERSCCCSCWRSRSRSTCWALFELPVLGGRAQPAGSFGTGALAAFVATPCAGPFLGAALGTALAASTGRLSAGVRGARTWASRFRSC